MFGNFSIIGKKLSSEVSGLFIQIFSVPNIAIDFRKIYIKREAELSIKWFLALEYFGS